MKLERQLPNEQATLALGAALSRLAPGGLVTLEGPLGAGKTTLVRAFLRALGHEGAVRSPTYTLLEPYEVGGCPIVHLDLYRLAEPEELEELGLRDYLHPGTWLFVEWPQRGHGVLPQADLEIQLRTEGAGRHATLQSRSALGEAWLAALSA